MAENTSKCCCRVNKKKLYSVVFAAFAVCGRVGYFIVTPLWLDHFSSQNTTSNYSLPDSIRVQNETDGTPHAVSVIFLMITQWTVATLVFGAALLVIKVAWPHQIGHVERSYPKKHFVVIGVTQGVSSVLFNFSLSGSRTPLYLQAILSNSTIPIQFIVRFLVLKKKSTRLKIGCAVVVVLAEFICLLPTIFPGLDGSDDKQTTGSSGIGRYLWPLCFVCSQVPFAVANALIERSVQKKARVDLAHPGQLNLIYFIFWWCLVVTCTVAALFWTDLIPGFGTSASVQDFGKNFIFDTKCILGLAGCSSGLAVLGWANYIFNILGCMAFAGLMRFSEGASFVVIVLTLRTPILFIFWTLFRESPFGWHPDAHLVTWLSLGGIALMLPAIVIYDMKLGERQAVSVVAEGMDDERGLLEAASINTTHSDRTSYEASTIAQG